MASTLEEEALTRSIEQIKDENIRNVIIRLTNLSNQLSRAVANVQIQQTSTSEKVETKVNSLNEKLDTSKQTLTDKISSLKTETATINQKIKDLPAGGDISSLLDLKERDDLTLVRLAIEQGVGRDDTLDCTYREWVPKTSIEFTEMPKAKAPEEMQNSIFSFNGPKGNKNFVNARENHFSDFEINLLTNLFPIPDRTATLKDMQDKDASSFTYKVICDYRYKWDDSFCRLAPNWNKETTDIEDFFAQFWAVASSYKIDSPSLFKLKFYEKVAEAYPNAMGFELRPEHPELAEMSPLKYYLKLRRKFSPFVSAETASHCFYNMKQASTQLLDDFFYKKLKAFKNMQPSKQILGTAWRQFYYNVCKTLKNEKLGEYMLDYVETMNNLQNTDQFLVQLSKRGNHYVTWGKMEGLKGEEVKSCLTIATQKLYFETIDSSNSTIAPTQLQINEIHPKKSDVMDVITMDNTLSELDTIPQFQNEEGLDESTIMDIIGALNFKSKAMICWYCNKANHTVVKCLSKKKGNPPDPNSKIGLTKAKMFMGQPKNTFRPPNTTDRQVNQLSSQETIQDKTDRQIAMLMDNAEKQMKHNLDSVPYF